MSDKNINIFDKSEEEYIYQRKDFLNLGIPEGSFHKVMKDLGLETGEYCMEKRIDRNVRAKFYTVEAYKKVSDYIESKKNTNNKTELLVYKENQELKTQVQQLQNAVAMMESKYTKQVTELELSKKDLEREIDGYKAKIEIQEIEKSKELGELKAEKDREIDMLKENWKNATQELEKNEKEINRLKNRGWWARLWNK